MICPVCTRDPCICQSRHWNHWVESDTIEKFDAFVKSLQKNPGLVQRDQIDHYIAQLQELRRYPDHVVTSISIDSLGGRGAGVPFQIGQGRLERTRERREFGGREYLVYGSRVVPDHREPVYPRFGGMQNPNHWGGKCSPFPTLMDIHRPSSPEWDALFGRLARQPGVSRFLGLPEPRPRTLEEMPVAQIYTTIKKLLEERRMTVDYELCNEVGLPIDPVDRERRAGVVVLSQKARQAQATFQYQVLGGGFPRDGVPLLHSGLVCDEELIYPRTTGKTMTGIGSLMDGLRAKRKKQHNRKFWVDKQQPAWAGGRKRGKR